MAFYCPTEGKQQSGGTFKTRREAEKAYAKAKVLDGVDPSAKSQTVYPARVSRGITVAAYAEAWLPHHELSGHAREVYQWVLAKYIVPRFGAQAVSQCDTKAIAG